MGSILKTLVWLTLCVSAAIAASASVKISGTIRNQESDSISITYNNNRLAYYPISHYAAVGANGAFSFRFDFPEGAYIQAELHHGSHIAEIFLHDGDSLVLTADARHFDSSLKFAGRGAAIQNFVAGHTLARGRLNQYTLRLKNSMGLSPQVFSKAIVAEQDAELSYLGKYSAGLAPSFLSFWKSHYIFYNYFFMLQYPSMHTTMLLRRFTDTIPDSAYSILQQVPSAFHDSLLSVPPYLLYLSAYYETKLKATHFSFPLSAPGNSARFIDSVNNLAYDQLPHNSAAYFVAQNLYARIRYQSAERNAQEMARFKSKWPASEYLPLLQNQWDIAQRLAPGQPAPDIDVVSDSGKRMKLSDLRGKVVYLTFWSTQCRQCVGEMRADKRVKDVFSNKPVAFVYVSLDDDSAAAQKLVQQFRISGYFSWTHGNWYAPEATSYGVQGLPARYLIDRDGNFAMQNPPSPTQKTELIVAISRLY